MKINYIKNFVNINNCTQICNSVSFKSCDNDSDENNEDWGIGYGPSDGLNWNRRPLTGKEKYEEYLKSFEKNTDEIDSFSKSRAWSNPNCCGWDNL